MEQTKLQLTCGGDQEKRRALDYYPTPTEVTHALMQFLHNEFPFYFNGDLSIWEPACGEGKMSEVIKSYGHKVFSTDINHTGYGMGDIDYLNHNDNTHDAIITNPPFCHSEQFIQKAITESTIVCMLLKSQYWHAKSRYKLFKSKPPSYVLPLTWRPDFLEHERKAGDKKGAPTMEVAWSVWVTNTGTHTKYIPLLKP